MIEEAVETLERFRKGRKDLPLSIDTAIFVILVERAGDKKEIEHLKEIIRLTANRAL